MNVRDVRPRGTCHSCGGECENWFCVACEREEQASALDGGIHEAGPVAPTAAPAAAASGRRFELRSFAEVAPRNVEWLVPGLIPLRTLTLVAGVGGLGKSIYLAGIAANVSRGSYLDGEPADVIVISYEDTAEEVWRPRLEAAVADLNRVHEFRFCGVGLENMELPRDLEELRRLVREVNAKLVVIDPVVAALSLTLDSHKNQHVRVALAGLSTLTEEENCAAAMVGHLNKAPTGEAYLRVADSIAFWNASRSVVLLTDDPEEPDTVRLIAQRKTNWARMRPVERHQIEEIILPDTFDPVSGKPIVTARMRFVEIADDVDGASVLAPRKETPKTEQAETELARLLANGEWHESRSVKTALEDAGYTGRTISRAAESVGVESERRGYPASTWWRLPPVAPKVPHKDGATDGPAGDSAQPSRSEDAVAPVAPTVMGTGGDGPTEANPQPRLGDPMYQVVLADANRDGHLTLAESRELHTLHRFIEASRRRNGEAVGP